MRQTLQTVLSLSLSLSLHPSKIHPVTIPWNCFILYSQDIILNNFFHGSSITTEGENTAKSCSLREVRAVMDIEADIVPA